MTTVLTIKNDTREKILQSALKTLAHSEYHDCLVDKIAEQAGVAKGTIYLYFKSKDELYISLIEKVLDDMQQIVEQVRKGKKQPLEQIKELLVRLQTIIDTKGHVLKMLTYEVYNLKGSLQKRVHTAYGKLFITLNKLVSKGIETHAFRNFPPALISISMVSMLTSVMRYKSKTPPSAPTLSIDMIFELLTKGIAQ